MWWIFINIHSKAHVLIMWLISVRLINDVCLRLECSHFKLICVQKRSKAPGSAGMVPWFWRLRLSVPADTPPPPCTAFRGAVTHVAGQRPACRHTLLFAVDLGLEGPLISLLDDGGFGGERSQKCLQCVPRRPSTALLPPEALARIFRG